MTPAAESGRDAGPTGPGPTPWEAAYLRFETPEQETRKFLSRLTALGAGRWPRDIRVIELFCGRGNGLRALARLGFTRVLGVDLSPTLVALSDRRGDVVVGDCRLLPFADGSREIAIVQGGLHHLLELPEHLDQTLREVRRVLAPGGRLVVVEPWMTPFLRVVHRLAAARAVRSFIPRLEALGTMIDLEGETYRNWLDSPDAVLSSVRAEFEVELCRRSWGKLLLVGRKAPR